MLQRAREIEGTTRQPGERNCTRNFVLCFCLVFFSGRSRVGRRARRGRGLPGLPEDQRDESGARVHPLPATSDALYSMLSTRARRGKKTEASSVFFPVHTEVSTPKMTGVLLLDMGEVLFAKGI